MCTGITLFEARVGRARINEIRPSELAHVSQSLEHFRVDEIERQVVDPDVIPHGVAQDLEVQGPPLRGRYPFGPAFFVAESTLPNFSKFSRNIFASFLACAS